MDNKLFKLRGEIPRSWELGIEIGGVFLLIFSWWFLTSVTGIIPDGILPGPVEILATYPELIAEHELFQNIFYSVKLNVLGYVEAILICLPLGFVIGLFPFFRALLHRYSSAIRFVPLTAVTGLFIVWFGIGDNMKVQFLAFGIIVYLLPVVVSRIMAVEDVYLNTVNTLGATRWQAIKHVFIPAVTSRVFDDVRVLVAISWTYIIVAELLNRTGGVGSMIYVSARLGRIPEVYAILIAIIFIGFLQDQIFKMIDKRLFKFKHAKSDDH